MDLAQSVIAFTLMALVVTLTPGLDMVLVLRQSLRGRRSVAFATAMGICVGALLWGVAAAAGLAALFVASQAAYNVLRFAGVAYLLWLGWG
ncbi:MAG: LysE family transporter, partial [Propionicimonas sp.]